MSSLILDNLPPHVLNWLNQEASRAKRSPAEEAACLLEKAFREATEPRLPDLVPSEEFSAPFDLPRPDNAERVPFRQGEERLPDPIVVEEE